MNRIIVDTDIGDDVDDVLALTFALLCPHLDIKAITTVTPWAEKRSKIVKHLLKLIGKTDIPVGSGIELPMRGLSDEELAKMTTEKRLNQYAAIPLEEREQEEERVNAAELIIQMVERYPQDISIAAIGPLSNIALALRLRPSIASKIRSIALMGGEVQVHRQEHNITWDPEAAEVVLTSGIPLFFGTWSVTRQLILCPEDCRIIENSNAELGVFLGDCIKRWWPSKGSKPGPVMYDLAPLAWCFDRSFFETRPMHLRVETSGKLTRGMTIASDRTPNAEVTTGMKSEALHQLFMETVSG
ncbi:hypothetical protein B1748_27225 [Paenibacillus sp. MY03]|uniref:nucleoside hydrolase n=1 Tax=Paenibacillus sp. MY03 TaxID=302980 RepID=UPI000B3C9F93|nr:nucleoside hydrolase [Paenibacillus sp. MY03]OUS71106.1 hypothetical protein B1748_27225 [Paenibacillus sp. MY03]